jgi:hypothetical protein
LKTPQEEITMQLSPWLANPLSAELLAGLVLEAEVVALHLQRQLTDILFQTLKPQPQLYL